MKDKLNYFLKKLIEIKGSDLHLKGGSPAYIRVNGDLIPMGEDEQVTHEDMADIVNVILNASQYDQLIKHKELDCAYALSPKKRFRVNIYHQINGLSVVLRVIPEEILSIDALNLPEVVKEFTELDHGLLLVTGVSGSGKTTTLASILDSINKSRRKHIISIEDPIEYMHEDQMCLVSQRSIGTDTHSFANALRAALREDIDIIFIGELRDSETAKIALHAANTGHLVVSTLHTLDAKETISRLLSMFPREEQENVRMTLSFVLEGIISQRLVNTREGERVPAVEVMKRTKRISELIAENRDSEILESIVKGKDIYGTQSFDQSLLGLYNEGKIGKKTALKHATNPSDMSLTLQGITRGTGYETAAKIRKSTRGVFDLKDQKNT